ncbi:DUF488 domain-containing protein [Thioalkalivibrio sp. HK1]|uniref:DUF488 domain-containing protein n=1 Tax=Thioalkalivibrio sp. HK1 TaxID=1469245 RepID=UPI000470CF38|nr:DUF488 domain-containing protein [Thioalkalivibrio sp. HK1]
MNPPTLFTIGHSNHPLPRMIDLLQKYDISLVVDVRSSPWSRYNPQFNRPSLSRYLESQGIAYLFLGRELGGRPDDPDCYDEGGHIRYDIIAEKPWFRRGLARIVDEAKAFEIALMCAEKEPLHCHRTLLVSHALVKEGSRVVHILADGSAEPHRQTMDRLIRGVEGISSEGGSGRGKTLDLFAFEEDSTRPTTDMTAVPAAAADETSLSIDDAISMQTRRWGFKRDRRKR